VSMSNGYVFGGALDGGSVSKARLLADGTNQDRLESLTATTRRRFEGPKVGGQLSIDLRCGSSAGVTSATGFTIWYSNLPNPSIASDDDWVQDTVAGTVLALTATGKTFADLSGKFARWVMLKADVTAGTAGVRAFARAEGA